MFRMSGVKKALSSVFTGKRGACSGEVPAPAGSLESDTEERLLRLPPELLEHVFTFCHPSSLACLRLVCQFCKAVVDGYVARLPATAAELRAKSGGRAGDGEYNLAMETKRFGRVPVRVYCHDMAGQPREYITLLNSSNVSVLKTGGTGSGKTVNTTFCRVRLLPPSDADSPMHIVCTDFTFANSTGAVCITHGNGTLNTLYDCAPLGVAMHSMGEVLDNNTSSAVVDLQGTGLVVVCQFRSFGCGVAESRISNKGQVVRLRGGGYPGGCGPASALDAHHATMIYGEEVTNAKRAWESVPIVIRVQVFGATEVRDCALTTWRGQGSWNDGVEDDQAR